MKKLISTVVVATGLMVGAVTPSYANRTGDVIGGVLFGGLVGAAIANNNGGRVYSQPAPVYVQPAPVYVQPAPVYYPPPAVYVQPAPVYVQPGAYYGYQNYGYYGGYRHGYGHHRGDYD